MMMTTFRSLSIVVVVGIGVAVGSSIGVGSNIGRIIMIGSCQELSFQLFLCFITLNDDRNELIVG